MIENKYFAAKEADKTAGILLGKAHKWFLSMESNGYLDKLKTMWAAYHGAYYTDSSNGHQISFGGEQGELVQVAVNEIRNVAQHMLVYITSTRPAMQARSTNTDYKSIVQTKLANGLLDYFLRDKRLENYLRVAVEHAIVLGSGYIKLEWNATGGEEVDFDEELNIPIKEGDIEFSNLSAFDVFFDCNREDDKHDWLLCRSFKNRYDLIAKYPEFEELILKLPSKNQYEHFNFSSCMFNDTDLIPIYEFYHKRSEAMPDGRYMLFLSEDVTLLDTPMPYRSLPIYKIAPSHILGTAYGYSNLFDLLPLQDLLNSLYSTAATNQTAFGVQNIIGPKGADISVSELQGGLHYIEADESRGQIRSLQLTNTPKEIFEMINLLKKDIETLSGVNSVARGNPDANLRSGNALALVQSMTLQFMSGLQQSYVAAIEDVGTGLINVLKDHAKVPRVAMIAGKANRTNMKQFTGDDLSSINRVIVDVANPLASTTAGRVEMAGQLLQMGAVKTPEHYFSVINTGQLDLMTEDTQSQLFLVKDENERLIDGNDVVAVFIDDHALHIKEHGCVLSDPELRIDTDLVQRTLAHIQEHIELLKYTDPDILQIRGQQPLMKPPPQQQGQMDGMGAPLPNVMGGQPAATMLDQQGVTPQNLPQPAQAPDVNGIPQPNTPEQAMQMVSGLPVRK
jgi:hypothetical protein